MDEIQKELKGFLDADGRVKSFPAKWRKKIVVFYYLASKFEPKKEYTEKEVNALLNDWTLWGDPATVRRGMFDFHLLNRTADGKFYWKEETPPALEDALKKFG